jgi:hypothetical protein
MASPITIQVPLEPFLLNGFISIREAALQEKSEPLGETGSFAKLLASYY